MTHARTITVLALTLAACTSEPTMTPVRAREHAAASAPTTAAPAGPHVRFTPATPGELAPIVRTFVAEARAEGRTPLVYVGATWCEPCRYFHDAASRGELDAELPALALLELDLDRDRDRIVAAGYGSEMIPLFAVPAEDGRASEGRIEGSIRGPGSPLQIAPRLRELLGVLR